MVQIRLPDHGPLLHLLFILLLIIANVVSATDILPERHHHEAAVAAAAAASPSPDLPTSDDLLIKERAAPTAPLPSPPLSVNNPGMAPPIGSTEPDTPASEQAQQSATSTTESTSNTMPTERQNCPVATGQNTSTQDDRYIKIAGILVPAIVAIGLGIAGMVVTLHVNSSPRSEDENNYRSN